MDGFITFKIFNHFVFTYIKTYTELCNVSKWLHMIYIIFKGLIIICFSTSWLNPLPRMHTHTQRYPMCTTEYTFTIVKQKIFSFPLIRSSGNTLLLAILLAFPLWSQDGCCTFLRQAHIPVKKTGRKIGVPVKFYLHLGRPYCVTWPSWQESTRARGLGWASGNKSTLATILHSQVHLYPSISYFTVL